MSGRHARAIRNMRAADPYPHAHAAIAETLTAATPAEWAEGANWYATAHRHAARLTPAVDAATPAAGRNASVTPTERAAGIIAALSPQCSWGVNLDNAERFIASNGTAGVHFGLSEDRAREILHGADPRHVLGGRKVRSFYLNIAYPTYAGPVTVDRHAIAVLCGMTTPETIRRHGRYLERPGAYVHAAAHYRAAARTYGVRPHELQAVAWVTHRARDTGPGDF